MIKKSGKKESLIVERGKSDYIIAVGRDASKTELFAAEELQGYIKKISGALIPVERYTGKLKDKLLLIGNTPETKERAAQSDIMDISTLGEDGFIIKSIGDNLILTGNRDRGTLYSVYAFLEELGVRFIEPGEDGEVIPESKTIKVAEQDKIERASFTFREIDIDLNPHFNIQHQTEIISWACKNRVNYICITAFHTPSAGLIKNFSLLVQEIKKRDLNLIVGNAGIAYYLILPEKYMKGIGKKPANWDEFIAASNENISKHPTWYGIGRGEKIRKIKRATGEPYPCISNSEVVSRMANNAVAFFKYHPEVDVLRLALNDCAISCSCRKCKEQSNKIKICELPDRLELYLQATKKIAKAVYEHNPHKIVAHSFMGQSQYLGVPVSTKSVDLPPNILYCQYLEHMSYREPIYGRSNNGKLYYNGTKNRSRLKFMQWTNEFVKKGKQKFVAVEMHSSGYYRHLYSVAPHTIDKSMKYYAGNFPGYIGASVFTNTSKQWHLFGVNLYVHYKLAWDIKVSVERILDDYFEKFYRKSAYPMKEFIGLIEKNGPGVTDNSEMHRYGTWKMLSKASDTSLLKWVRLFENVIKDLDRCEKLLGEAEKLNDDVAVKKRLKMDRYQWRYLYQFCQINLGRIKSTHFFLQAKREINLSQRDKLFREAEKEIKSALRIAKKASLERDIFRSGSALIQETIVGLINEMSIQYKITRRFQDELKAKCTKLY